MRTLANEDPGLAARALAGLTKYEHAARPPARFERAGAFRAGPACLRDHGGSGPPLVLVPSLINPPHILDLDADTSLTRALAVSHNAVLLLDWGPAADRSDLDVSAHVEQLLLPLLDQLGERASLVGYCLGGTMAIAAANLTPVRSVATLAAPWHFANYPDASRNGLSDLWNQSRGAAQDFGALPMEMLQAAFWSLDPRRTVTKFAEFAALPADSPEARRFVTLEDWANEGEPLPYPAARQLMEDFFAADLPGRGEWTIAGRTIGPAPGAPMLHFTAARDAITPAAAAPPGPTEQIASGHVGMIIGSARSDLHRRLSDFLSRLAAGEPTG